MKSAANSGRRASPLLVSAEDLVGLVLQERFVLEAILGEGAMGAVFRARQLSIDRHVAIKILKLEHFENSSVLERFQREIQIIGTLTHDNIVRVLDTGRIDALGIFFLAMELVGGGALSEVLDRHPFQPAFALEVAYQICAALTEPHQLGIVHRDIKPENLLLSVASDETLRLKVVDFGVARARESAQQRLTVTGMLVGTPAYIAPEIARGSTDIDIDGRADLYAVGVILFEMLTGQLPFYANNPMSMAFKHVNQPPPSLVEMVPRLQAMPDLVRLVERLLAKSPDDRPADALTTRRIIEDIRDNHGLPRVRLDPGRPLEENVQAFLRPLDERTALMNASSLQEGGREEDAQLRDTAEDAPPPVSGFVLSVQTPVAEGDDGQRQQTGPQGRDASTRPVDMDVFASMLARDASEQMATRKTVPTAEPLPPQAFSRIATPTSTATTAAARPPSPQPDLPFYRRQNVLVGLIIAFLVTAVLLLVAVGLLEDEHQPARPTQQAPPTTPPTAAP